MRCTKCGRELEEGMKYCPSCGREVGRKIKCETCGHEIQDTDRYCPYCGEAKNHAKAPNDNYVPKEPQENTNDNDIYVKNDNAYQHWENSNQPREKAQYSKPKSSMNHSIHDDPKLDHEAIKNDKYRGYWKKPLLWIISLCLIVVVAFTISQIANTSDTSDVEDEVRTTKVVGGEALKFGDLDNDAYVDQTNQMIGSSTSVYDDDFYYILDGEINVIKNVDTRAINFTKSDTVYDDGDAEGSLYVTEEYIYYSDVTDDFYRYSIEDETSEMILDNAFYINVIEDKVYYQNDTDNESIHVYDLNTGEDKAINNEKSYCLLIDTDKQLIYYYTSSEEICTLKAVSFDGSTTYTLVENVDSAASITKHENNLYYCREDHLYTLDVSEVANNMTDTKINDDRVYMINSFNDGLVYMTNSYDIKWCNYEGKEVKEFDFIKSEHYITLLQVEGDKVFAFGSDGSKKVVYVFDLKDDYCFSKSTSNSGFDLDDYDEPNDDEDEGVDIDGSVEL